MRRPASWINGRYYVRPITMREIHRAKARRRIWYDGSMQAWIETWWTRLITLLIRKPASSEPKGE